ncbi:MAG: type II secretion system F family protein [Clostridia bacterium]|nr:type II secretion system F family protein [Clostridia bacterium]
MRDRGLRALKTRKGRTGGIVGIVKEYDEKMRERLVFIYGDRSEKKIKERKNLFAVTPLIAAAVLAVLLVLRQGVGMAAAAAVIVLAAIPFAQEYSILDKAKKKKLKMRLCLSNLMERMAVLLDAGISVWSAFVAVGEVMDPRKDALAGEVRRTIAGFSGQNGYFYSPEEALEDMAERCSDTSISTFVSLVLQNSRKGGHDVAAMLRMAAVNQRAERKAIVKQMADEAATLMVIPSVMILGAVLVLIAAPAVIQFLL